MVNLSFDVLSYNLACVNLMNDFTIVIGYRCFFVFIGHL